MENLKKILDANKIVLADFYADWCAPCKMMTPILKDLKQAMGAEIEIVKFNIDSPLNHGLTSNYEIKAVPTLILFKNGKQVWRHSGIVSTEDLRELIQKQL